MVRQIGLWNNSDDTTNINVTTTYEWNLFNALQNLGYNHTSFVHYSLGYSVTQLNNNRLLLMGAYALPNENDGHIWVVDGYKLLRILYIDNNELEPTYFTETKTYNHVNWGWSGIANGYFYDGIFSITNALEYDYSLNIPASNNFHYNIRYSAVYH